MTSTLLLGENRNIQMKYLAFHITDKLYNTTGLFQLDIATRWIWTHNYQRNIHYLNQLELTQQWYHRYHGSVTLDKIYSNKYKKQ